MSTIPLAKGFAPEKLQYPVLLSEKLDGVPVCITVSVEKDGRVSGYTTQSRQAGSVFSCESIVREFVYTNELFFEGFPGLHSVVGELVQSEDHRAPFKDTGGIVRKQQDAGKKLSLGIFEYNWENGDDLYIDRIRYLDYKIIPTDNVFVIPYTYCSDEQALNRALEKFTASNPSAEGMVARSHNDVWAPGKRSWGYQKVLNEPTIDLHIVGCEEAVDSKTGEGKGMAGRLIASYKGEHIGIGPGKLTHPERAAMVAENGCGIWNGPRMAQIKYKADDSYDALRQPTFQHWRDDKEVPDA